MRDTVKLSDFIRPHRKALAAAVIMGMLSAVLNVSVPAFISRISDVIGRDLFGNINLAEVRKFGLICLLLIAGGFLFADLQNRIMVEVSRKFTGELRKALDDKVDRLPLHYFDIHVNGDTLSILTNDVNTLNQALLNGTIAPILSGVTMIGCLVLMFVTNVTMAVGSVLATLAGMFVMAFALAKTNPYVKRQQEVLGELNGDVSESLNGFVVIKSFNAEKDVRESFCKKNEEMFRDNLRAQFTNGIMSPLMGFSGNLGYVTVCIIGAYLIYAGTPGVSIASVIAFILYVRQFSTPLAILAGSLAQLQPAFAASGRIFGFLNEEEMPEAEAGKAAFPEKTEGAVEFDHISFGYVPEVTVIHDFSAVIKPGSKVAIVGPTGAGKSTLINLLLGYYETGSGTIRIDGTDISEVPKEDLRNRIGYVPQDVWTFEGSIKDNIRYMNDSLSDEDIDRIIGLAGLEHFVSMLPEGADTVLDENCSISAGQKQLITIARAMAKNAPILVLDEATSNIDTRMEKLVQAAVDELIKGRTSFVIAHRLSTIRNADLILVMKDGDICEQGDHRELMEKKGFYYELYNSQFESED
ncbi:MAG: ABC transporter ATP-binding protein [Lachnospiraceae bacterium]|nr:ABC transporter ATP-binding protein [Lachnospiraceae bacterium]